MKVYMDYLNELLDQFGLTQMGWKAGTHRQVYSLGSCYFYDRIIRLSTIHMKHQDRETMMNTVRHEVAHALAYERFGHHGHGIQWRDMCAITGAIPRTHCASADHIPSKYTATCGTCGHVYRRHRMTKAIKQRGAACSACCNEFNGGRYSDKYRLEFTDSSKAATVS